MVFQDYTAFDHRTVADNIAFARVPRRRRGGGAAEQALEWIRRVGLPSTATRTSTPRTRAGCGSVAIARSLVLHPRIVLDNEPFGALDPATRYNMQDLLVETLARPPGDGLLFITHSIEEAVYLGDRVYVMSSSPGTILKQVPSCRPLTGLPRMQRDAAFMEIVYGLRTALDNLEVAAAQARGEHSVTPAPSGGAPPGHSPVCPESAPIPWNLLALFSAASSVPRSRPGLTR
ncbi:MAG: hypothetical protein R2882_06065 [Gemmatimonadales bacterium]